MNLNKKILYFAIGITILFTIFGIITFSEEASIAKKQAELKQNFIVLKEASTIPYHISQIQQFYTDASLTKNTNAISEAKQHEGMVFDSIDLLLESDAVNQEKKDALKTLKTDVAKYSVIGKEMYDAYSKSKKDGDLVMEEFDKQGAILTSSEDELIKYTQTNYDAISTGAENSISFLRNIILLSFAFIIAIIIFAYYVVRKEVTEKIVTMSLFSEKLSEGDYTQDINLNVADDEIGTLSKSMNNMTLNMRDIITKLSNATASLSSQAEELSASSEEVTSGTQQVANTMQEVAKGAENQSSKITQINEIAKNISASFEEGKKSTKQVVDKTRETNKNAKEISIAAQDASASLKKINETVKKSADTIAELGKKSDEIGKIIEVINNIAEQTNLLALNAAIEAARAGDAGRGFAVVADEVRKLAEESSKATEQISDLIKTIQNGTKDAVTSMQKGKEEVDKGDTVISTALFALNTVAADIAIIADKSEENMAMTEIQNAGIMNFMKSINEIAAISEENSAAAEEVSSSTEEQTSAMMQVSNSAQELAKIAEQLRDITTKFKVRINENNIIDLAKSDHIMWRQKVREAVTGKRNLTKDDVKECKSCRFGKWYYGEGKDKFGDLPEFKNIEEPHKKLHTLGMEIVELLDKGDKTTAHKKFEDVQKVSENLLELLELLGKKTK